jgi:hypothetical protein
MKKITTYILLLASVAFAACKQEIPVSRDHDINAEVSELETSFEMKTLYCNLTDASVNLDEVAAYIKAQDADVVTLLGSGAEFELWVAEFAANEGLKYAVQTGTSTTVAACLSKKAIKGYVDALDPGVQTSPILHCSIEGIHFLVAELKAGGLVKSDGSQTEDFNADRTAQIEDIVLNTVDNPSYYTVGTWVMSIDMESPATLDITKYGVESIMVENCVANDVMTKNGLIDCVAAFNNYYIPSCVDALRHNFLYTTNKGWQMMQPLTVDTAVSAMGAHHYPVIVTLKSEE